MVVGRSKGYNKCWFNASEITTICKLTQDKVIIILMVRIEERENWMWTAGRANDIMLFLLWWSLI